MKHFIVVLLLSLWTVELLAGDQQRFVIGVESQRYYPHYHYSNDRFSGFGRAVLDAFAKQNNYIFEYRAFPVDELFHQLIARKIDFKYPDNPYWQHEIKEGVRVAYSEPVTPYIDGVSVLKARAGMKLGELKTLGSVKGFTPLNYEYQIKMEQLTLVESPSITELIDWLLSGEIDGLYANVDVIGYQTIKHFGLRDALKFEPLLPYTTSSYMLSTTSQPRVLKKFNAFLKRERALIDRLKQDYGIKAMADDR